MFIQIFNKITDQSENNYFEIQNKGLTKSVNYYINYAITLWCQQLGFSQDITNDILSGFSVIEVRELTNYFYEEWKPKKEKQTNWLESLIRNETHTSRLYKLVANYFNRINIRNEDMRIIVILAFAITSVGYLLYNINKRTTQQYVGKEESKDYIPNSTLYPIQKLTKNFLVLVISASQVNILESLKSKGYIDSNDGETLYKLTKYLWIGSENYLNQKKANINRYLVSAGEESEYDIHLVYLEIKQIDEGFKPNINQLDRYDAFRKLPELAVNFDISPRLQMEAYGNFEIYNR